MKFLHKHFPKLLTSLNLTAACLLMLSGISVAADRIEIQNVEIGIDGHFRIGCWAPITFDITLPNSAKGKISAQIVAVDPDGHGVITTLPELETAQTVAPVKSLFRSGKIEAPLTIEVLENQQTIARRTIRIDGAEASHSLKQDAHFWILANEQPAFTAAVTRLQRDSPERIFDSSFDKIPLEIADSLGLDSANLIVINADTPVSTSQSTAIRDWVQRGGRLLICVGGDTDVLRNCPLSTWLPFLPTGTSDLRNLNGFNQLVPGSGPLRMLGSIPAAQFNPTDGTIVASDVGNPLALRAAYGLGSVIMLSVRLDQRPFSDWGSRAEFAMALVDFEPTWKTTSGVSQGASADSGLNPTGVSDLQTQLIHALDHYESVPRPSYWVIIGWSALLILIIGPLDYFILHHLVGRPQLTWITLPVWLTVITLWSYSAAQATNGVPQQANQLELLDIDMSLHKARGRSWLNFYSDETRRHQVHAHIMPEQLGLDPAKASVSFLQTSWIERPESGYRGMYRSGGLEPQKPAYHLSADRQGIDDLPTRIWSTGSLGSVWEANLNPEKPIVEANLSDPGTGRLSGTLTYQGNQELTEWFIAYGNFAYFPRTSRGQQQTPLQPGDQINLRETRSNILRGVLIGLTHTSIFKENQNRGKTFVVREDYDTLSYEPYPILRTLSFHEVTGGRAYTNLGNDSLQAADLSNLLELHRAVLFGRMKTPLTQFTVNGNPPNFAQQDSVVRIILPVDFELADVNAPPDPSLLKIK